jgi:hypothetical protein
VLCCCSFHGGAAALSTPTLASRCRIAARPASEVAGDYLALSCAKDPRCIVQTQELR